MSAKLKNRNAALATARHAPHKKHGRKFLSVYAPYLPLVLILGFGFLISFGWTPVKGGSPLKHDVLAYATSMSISDLLAGTNAQRTANGLAPLSLNTKLNTSAQNKANDMVTRNYWSHNDPDGNEPWVFFDAVGYKYQKAGENLAYGFATSSDTINGWMNSPGHRANILDTSFQEVGFGFANASNYVGNGNETVVVAHYAKPLVAVAPAPAPQPVAVAPASNPAVDSATATPAPAQATQPNTPSSLPETPATSTPNQPITSEQKVPETTPSIRVTTAGTLFGSKAQTIGLVLSIATVIAICLWVGKHAYVVRRMIKHGEKFVIHHPIIDVTVIAFLALVTLLTRTSGVIK